MFSEFAEIQAVSKNYKLKYFICCCECKLYSRLKVVPKKRIDLTFSGVSNLLLSNLPKVIEMRLTFTMRA